jgi:hypothetical protein
MAVKLRSWKITKLTLPLHLSLTNATQAAREAPTNNVYKGKLNTVQILYMEERQIKI